MTEQENCPVCRTQARRGSTQGNRIFTECPRCGHFVFTQPDSHTKAVIDELPISEKTALSRIIRLNQNTEAPVKITDGILKNIQPITPYEQAENLLLHIGEKQETPATLYEIDQRNRNSVYALVGIPVANQDMNFEYVVSGLEKEGMLDKAERNRENSAGGPKHKYKLGLNFKGWQKYEELKRGKSDSMVAFMAMKFPEEGLVPPYTELETVVSCFEKAIAEHTEYTLLNPLLKYPKAGSIDVRLEQEVRRARFLIADLSHNNPGVYWEAGLAHGMGKPVFYTCKKGVETHFDINHHTTIFWTPGDEQKAAAELVATIQNTVH